MFHSLFGENSARFKFMGGYAVEMVERKIGPYFAGIKNPNLVVWNKSQHAKHSIC